MLKVNTSLEDIPDIHYLHVELVTARDFLVQRLGPDFARAAAGNKDNYVSASVSMIS